MASSVRTKLRLCSNKNALEQRSEEEEKSLVHLRQLFSKRQNCQYPHTSHSTDHVTTALSSTSSSSSIIVDGAAPPPQATFEMADAIGIADTINLLAASLKDMAGESSDGDFADMAELQVALEKATETLQSFRASRQEATTTTTTTTTKTLPTKDVTFYDGTALPKSPLKSTTTQTPRRSNLSSSSPLQVVTSSCPSPQRLFHSASAALSCSSGYLATIGDHDDTSPPPTPGLRELLDEKAQEKQNKADLAKEDYEPIIGHKNRRKQGKKLSLDFKNFAGEKDGGKKNIQITKGDIDIRIWGPSVAGITLTTGGTSSSCSGDNDDEAGSSGAWVINADRKDSEEKTTSLAKSRIGKVKPAPDDDRHRLQQSSRRPKFPWSSMKSYVKRERLDEKSATTTRIDPKGVVVPPNGATHLENLVLGAMKPKHTTTTSLTETAPGTMLRSKKDSKTDKKASMDTASDTNSTTTTGPAPAAPTATHDHNDKHRHDLMPAMSNLSYFSGVLPNRQFGDEKLKSVKTDHEKGFEVYLEESTSHYSSKKLRERAALSEKLLAKRREIRSIQQDLEACSQLLGKFGGNNALRSSGLAVIESPTSMRHNEPPPVSSSSTRATAAAATSNKQFSDKKRIHGAIIRE